MNASNSASRAWFAYPMVRGSGAFLVCVGSGVAGGALCSGTSPVNIPIFIGALIVGFVSIPIARRIESLGRPARRHIAAMTSALALELVLFWLIFTRLPTDTSPQVRWLWAFLLVGVHFLPMGFALGRRVVILGLACIVVAALGLIFGWLPFACFAVADGLLKVGFGASLAMTGVPGWGAHRSLRSET